MKKKKIIAAALVAALATTLGSVGARGDSRSATRAFLAAMTPPEEFAHPYPGKLVITRTADEAETRRRCTPLSFTHLALGCAKPIPAGCEIIISSDRVIAGAGLTFEFVIHHEIGHCNGWPADHSRVKQ
jgi:hypothetical protein